MTSLIKYNAALTALAEAKAVDEVKDLRDKADAMRIYAMQAKNKTLEIDAAEIRIRAERRLGEMLASQKETKGLNRGTAGAGDANIGRATGGSQSEPPVSAPPTLAEVGIDKKLSARAQQMAAIPEEEFEAEVGEWRERVSAENERVTIRLQAAGEKASAAKAPTPRPIETDDDTQTTEIEALRAEVASLRDQLAELALTTKELLEENAGMAAVFESDDKLGAMAAELKKLRELTRVLEERNRGLMNEKAEAIRAAKSWKGKFERLMKGTQNVPT